MVVTTCCNCSSIIQLIQVQSTLYDFFTHYIFSTFLTIRLEAILNLAFAIQTIAFGMIEMSWYNHDLYSFKKVMFPQKPVIAMQGA